MYIINDSNANKNLATPPDITLLLEHRDMQRC